ncbi:MAG: hypothetical protein K0S08_2241 [Gammaproteobacteria bacterium]|jgi:uncharacterized integral membrane protein (TIGR00697 family)|nr:hypothetical protein [Gammaproteobacteria bacterium]
MGKNYKHLPFLSMLVLTIMFLDAVLEYKPLQMPFGTMMASSFVFPLWFILTDIITEIYGPKISKKVLWSAFTCQLIISIVTTILIRQKSPATWMNQSAYDLILGHLPRITLSNFISIMLSGYININLLAKWQRLLKGKYFWLRSIGASFIAELLYSSIAVTLIGYQIFTLHQISTMILWSCAMKITYSTILAAPATLLVAWLKESEGIQFEFEKNPLSNNQTLSSI